MPCKVSGTRAAVTGISQSRNPQKSHREPLPFPKRIEESWRANFQVPKLRSPASPNPGIMNLVIKHSKLKLIALELEKWSACLFDASKEPYRHVLVHPFRCFSLWCGNSNKHIVIRRFTYPFSFTTESIIPAYT